MSGSTMSPPSPFDKTISSQSELIYSNNDSTITTTPAAWVSAMSVSSRNTGKWYAEYQINALGSINAIALGIGSTAVALTNVSGLDAHGLSYSLYDYNIRANNNGTKNLSVAVAAGGFLAIAVDLDSKDVWFRGSSGLWNGLADANPATGAMGLKSASFYNTALLGLNDTDLHLIASVYGNSIGTLNIGQSSFVGAIPAGFSAWNTVAATASTPTATPSPGPGMHRYWGIVCLYAPNGGGAYGLNFMAINDPTGVNLATDPTKFSDTRGIGGFPPSNLVRGLGGQNVWAAQSGAPAQVLYDFSNPVDIGSITITSRDAGDYTQAPVHLQLVSSDDGVTLNVENEIYVTKWIAQQQRLFPIKPLTAYCTFALFNVRNYDNGSNFVGFDTIKLLDQYSKNQASFASGASASSQYSASYSAANAIEGVDGDWVTDGSGGLIWWAFRYGSIDTPFAPIAGVRITARSSFPQNGPQQFDLCVGDDGTYTHDVYYVLKHVNDALPAWTVGEIRTYDLDTALLPPSPIRVSAIASRAGGAGNAIATMSRALPTVVMHGTAPLRPSRVTMTVAIYLPVTSLSPARIDATALPVVLIGQSRAQPATVRLVVAIKYKPPAGHDGFLCVMT